MSNIAELGTQTGIVDAHSHLGLNILHLGDSDNIQYFECPSDVYVENAERIGVTQSAVSYAPCPEYVDGDGITVRPCFWLFEHGQVSYYREMVDPETTQVLRSLSDTNPYSYANDRLIGELSLLNKKTNIDFYALGLIHPLLDTEEEIIRLLENDAVVGFKLHGLATHSGPKDVPDFIPRLLRIFDKPIVVHTDMLRSPSGNQIMYDLYNANHPGPWLEWAMENGVKIFLTHGARIDAHTIQKASTHEGRVLIGTSPDILLQSEPDKLAVDTPNYLQSLIEMCPHAILAFDIDFSWNVLDRTDWDIKDWDMVSRHQELIENKQQLQRVLSGNARSFYQI